MMKAIVNEGAVLFVHKLGFGREVECRSLLVTDRGISRCGGMRW